MTFEEIKKALKEEKAPWAKKAKRLIRVIQEDPKNVSSTSR